MTDSILRSYQTHTHTTIIPFAAAPPEPGALGLLTGETDGFAFDATTYDTDTAASYAGGPVGGTVAVINTADPGDNLSNVPLDASNLTQTGTSAKIVAWDSAPLARWTPHNLLQQSQTLGTTWSANNSTVTSNTTTAPDSTSTAETITENSANDRHQIEQPISITGGQVFTFSCYLKQKDRQYVALCLSDQSTTRWAQVFDLTNGTLAAGTNSNLSPTQTNSTITSAGSGWYRCTVTMATLAGAGNVYSIISLSNSANPGTWTSGSPQYTGDGTSGTYAWGAQTNRGPIATSYLAATSASRIGIPQGYDVAGSKFGILIEQQATNLALYSDDFTNAAWTKSNMTTAMTATGPDGSATSASTLTASAGNATALQAITSSSNVRVTSFWVKRRTGSGNIDLTQDNGSTWQTMTVTAGWTRVNLTPATLTNPTVGIRIVTNTDAIDVWGFQHEAAGGGYSGNAITSTILTLGAPVLRANDKVSCLLSTIPSYTSISYYGQIKSYDPGTFPDSQSVYVGLSDGTGSNRTLGYTSNNSNFSVVSDAGGSGQGTVTVDGGGGVGTLTKIGFRLQTNAMNAAHQGTTGTQDTTHTLPTVTKFFIGQVDDHPYQSSHYHHYAVALPRAMSDAELQTKTT